MPWEFSRELPDAVADAGSFFDVGVGADDESPVELFVVDLVNAVGWVDVGGETGGAAAGCVEDDPEAWSIIVG